MLHGNSVNEPSTGAVDDKRVTLPSFWTSTALHPQERIARGLPGHGGDYTKRPHCSQDNAAFSAMKALIRDRYGPPDVLDIRDVPRPVAKEDQVLVRVHACSLNDWDWGLLRQPTFPIFGSSGMPRVKILGSDVAGRVAEVGRGVRRFKPGFLFPNRDSICASTTSVRADRVHPAL